MMGDTVWEKRAPHRSNLPPPSAEVGRIIRVTHDGDGLFAPRMMSDRANAWLRGESAFVFAGSQQTGGARFFHVDLLTGESVPQNFIFPYGGETEGWSWLPDGSVLVLDGPRLRRVHPFNGVDDVVLDIRNTHPGCDLWQPHASDDGLTYSATVRQIIESGPYLKIGTVTIHNGKQEYWPAVGVLDESQVRRDGRGVLIKEDRGQGDDNRYIDLDTRETKWLKDQERAVQHSDCGPDFVVGEADKPDPGGCVIWQLDRLNEAPRFLFPSTNMGYVSVRGGRCLWSSDTHLSLVALDGSGITPLIEHGGYGSGYDDRVKANLDPTGQVACYMVHGSVYLMRVA